LIICCYLLVLINGKAAANPPWSIRINIPACTLELLHEDEVWRRFPVAVGKRLSPTPVGCFTISNVVANPTWYPVGRPPVPPGSDNPLGGYWLGLSIESYGIHGNNKPSSIGASESNGCIRMHNDDVALLVQLVSVGTRVEIVYQTVEIETTADKMWLKLYPDFYRQQPNVEAEIKKALTEKSLSYPVQWEALRQLIAMDRPLIVELPQELSLVLDGAEYPRTGFCWGEQVFLPSDLTRLWGQNDERPFIELFEFMRSYAGQVYGVFDHQTKIINLHTLRIYVNGHLIPLRGWFQEEPYLPSALVLRLGQELGDPLPPRTMAGWGRRGKVAPAVGHCPVLAFIRYRVG
jgi:hypothetical protein